MTKHGKLNSWLLMPGAGSWPKAPRCWRTIPSNARMQAGRRALGLMDAHLGERRFFVGDQYSIADIALYAYTHVSHEGGFDLSGYSNISAWMMRVQNQRNHVVMKT